MSALNLPHTVASVLDLFPPHLIEQAINHQARLLDDSVDDWEPRRIIAAEQLCNYMTEIHPRVLVESQQKLLLKLELLDSN